MTSVLLHISTVPVSSRVSLRLSPCRGRETRHERQSTLFRCSTLESLGGVRLTAKAQVGQKETKEEKMREEKREKSVRQSEQRKVPKRHPARAIMHVLAGCSFGAAPTQPVTGNARGVERKLQIKNADSRNLPR